MSAEDEESPPDVPTESPESTADVPEGVADVEAGVAGTAQPGEGSSEVDKHEARDQTHSSTAPDTESNPIGDDSGAVSSSTERLLDDNENDRPTSPVDKVISITDCSDDSYEANHRRAQVVATAGLVFNLAMMLACAFVAVGTDSSMMFVLSSQHLLDALGDILVIWRFWCDADDPANDLYDAQGSALISFCAMASCLYVITFTATKVVHKAHPHFEPYALALSGIIFAGSFTLAVMKVILAAKLDSATLHLDAMTSFFISILALIFIVASVAHHYEERTWLMEHIVALVTGTMLLAYAVYNLMRTSYAGNKWYHLKFWYQGKNFV